MSGYIGSSFNETCIHCYENPRQKGVEVVWKHHGLIMQYRTPSSTGGYIFLAGLETVRIIKFPSTVMRISERFMVLLIETFVPRYYKLWAQSGFSSNNAAVCCDFDRFHALIREKIKEGEEKQLVGVAAHPLLARPAEVNSCRDTICEAIFFLISSPAGLSGFGMCAVPRLYSQLRS
jgi:hypothetical protein